VNTKTDPKNCGSCGGFCPGANNTTTTNVTCNSGVSCGFSCKGSNYDVNDDPNDGCEASVPGNPTKASAYDLGSSGSCDDVYTFYAAIPSDTHEHEPLPPGFNPAVKAAPQWFKKIGTGAGAFCLNDVGIDLTQTSGTANCYSITLEANQSPIVTIPIAGGKANYEMDSGSYSSGSTIYFKVEKTCVTTRPEVANFTVNYHL
jgi:hypothetical protein